MILLHYAKWWNALETGKKYHLKAERTLTGKFHVCMCMCFSVGVAGHRLTMHGLDNACIYSWKFHRNVIDSLWLLFAWIHIIIVRFVTLSNGCCMVCIVCVGVTHLKINAGAWKKALWTQREYGKSKLVINFKLCIIIKQMVSKCEQLHTRIK